MKNLRLIDKLNIFSLVAFFMLLTPPAFAAGITIGTSAVVTMAGSPTITTNGSWANSGTFTAGSGTVIFNATAPGETLSGTLNGTSAFYNLQFNGSGGGWSNSSAMLVTNDLTVTAGTLSGTNNITVNGGDVTGNGTINLTGGTFLLDGTGSFGGTTDWTFNNLTFGDGTGAAASTATSSNAINISGTLTIAANQTLNTGSKTYNLTGSGYPITGTGTFNYDTSTFNFNATSAVNVPDGGAFYNVGFGRVADSTGVTYTTLGNFYVHGILTIGNSGSSAVDTLSTAGSASTILYSDANQTDPLVVTSQGSLSPGVSSVVRYMANDGAMASINVAGATYSTLDLGYSATDATAGTTYTLTGNITAQGAIRIGDNTSTNADTLNASSYTVTLSGTGSDRLCLANATFACKGNFTASTSTVNYTGTAATTVTATTYNNLGVGTTADADTVTYTLASGTTTVGGSLTVGNASSTGAGDTLTAVTNNSILDINGDVSITSKGTLVADDTQSFTVGGNWTNNGSFTDSGGTVTFDATTTGKTLSGTLSGTSDFSKIAFSGSGGEWTLGANLETSGASVTALTVTAGTLKNGGYSIIGNGASDTFSISNGAFFEMSGTSAYPASYTTYTYGATSTVRYLQTATATVVPATYGHLELGTSNDGAAAGVSYTAGSAGGQTITVAGNLSIGNALSTNADTFDVNTWDPTLDCNGDVTITAKGILSASNSGSFTIFGNYANNNTSGFTDNSGTVTFDATSTGKTLSGTLNGSSDFYNLIFNGSGGGWTNSAALSVANDLTVTAGTVTMGNAAFTVTGLSSITGTLNTSTGATGTRTFTGAVTVNSGGVWDLSGQNPVTDFGGGITMSGTTFNNGTGNTTFTASQALAGANNMTFGGAATINSGFVLTNNNTGTVTFDNTITGGNGSSSFTTGTSSYSKFANTVMSTGILTPSASGHTVEYSQSGAQTVKPPTTNSYYHLILSGSGAKTMTSITTIVGNFTMNNSVTATIPTTAISGNLTLNNTAGLTLAANLVVTGTSAIGDGTNAATLNQGATFNYTSGAVTVGAASSWTNTGTGDVTLSGNVSNAGTITLNSNNGSQCVNGADDIVVDSTVDNTTRSWSGAGTFTLYNLNVDDMTGTVTAYTSTFSGDTTWTVGACGITISGTIYQNDGSTVINCSGGGANTRTVDIRVNGAGSYTGDCTAAGGTYSITGVTVNAINDIVTVFLNGETEKAVTVSKVGSTSTNITDMNLYTNRVAVRTESGASALTNGTGGTSGIDYFDSSQDADIPFTVTTNDLVVLDGSMLLVFDNATTTTNFTPGGTVTTDVSSSGTDSVVDGDVTIQAGATLDMGTNALSIGGDFANAGTFSESGSPHVTTFTATSTGFTIDNGTGNLDNITFDGSGGGWSFSDASNTIAGDITMTTGTLSGTNSITVNGGDVTGNATINLTGGTFLLDGTGSFGGTTSWTFNDLTFGDGTGAATTTATGAAGTVNVSGNLVIAANQTLQLNTNDKPVDVNGNVTIDGTLSASNSASFNAGGDFTRNQSTGTFTDNSGTITLDATATGKNIVGMYGASDFYNVVFNGSGGEWTSSTALTTQDLTVTVGTLKMGHNLWINGNLTVGGSGVISKSGAGGSTTLPNGDLSNDGSITTNSITFGDAGALATHNCTGAGTVTLEGNSGLTIDTNNTVNAGGLTYVLSGTGATLFTINGTFNAQTSTVNYTGSAADSTVKQTTYYNLGIGTTSDTATGRTFTLQGGTTTVQGSLTIGNASSTNADTLTAITNNSILDVDQDVVVTTKGVLIADDSQSFTIGGNWTNNGTFTHSSGVVTFNADGTPTSKTIGGSASTTFNNVTLNTGTDSYSVNTSTILAGDLTMTAGTLTGSSSVTVNGGDVTGDGTINMTGGTFTVNTAGNFGGATAWIFDSLTIGGAGNATTTATGAGSITVNETLTIDTGDTLNAGSKTWTLSDSDGCPCSPFVKNGTFTSGTSTVAFTGTGTQTLAGSTTFYNLQVTTTAARAFQFTAGTTQSVASGGSVTFTGADGQLLTLGSTSAGTEWNLQADNAIASQTIQYVSVSDSNAGPFSTYTEMLAVDGTSTDGGNNTNWDFGTKALGFLEYF